MNLKSLRSVIAIAAIGTSVFAANALTLKEVSPANNSTLDEIATNAILMSFDATPDLVSWDDADKEIFVKGDNGISVRGLLNVYQDWTAGVWPAPTYINITFASPITEKGTYTLNLPAGKICEDGNYDNVNSEINLTWYVGTPAQKLVTPVKVTPEAGTTVEKIGKQDIFVYFEGQYEVPVKNQEVPVTLSDANGKVLENLYLYEAYTPSTNLTHFNMSLKNEITEDGVYTLTWPKGMIEGKDGSTNDEFSFSWTVFNPAANEGFLNFKEIIPACGEVESIPTEIKLYFHQNCDLNWDLDTPFEYKVTDASGATAATITVRGVQGGWGSPIYVPLYSNGIETPGTYTLKIPAGHYTVDGDPTIQNKDLTFTWTIKATQQGGDDNCTHDFEFVSCYPAKDSTYDFNTQGGAYDGVLTNWDGDAVYNPAVKPYIEDANGNRTISTSVMLFQGSLRINFDTNETKLWRTGAYNLVLPAGFAGTAEWKAANYLEGHCNAETVVPFNYIQDPNLDDVNNDFALEVSKFGYYNGSTCLVNFLDKPETVPNIKGSSSGKWVFASNKNDMSMDIYIEVFDVTNGAEDWLWGAGTFRQQVTSVTDVRTINGKNSDGEFEVEFSNTNFTLEFLREHQYEVRVGLYKQYDGIPEAQRICYDTYVARFEGTTKAYEYSTAKIVALSVPEGSIINSVAEGALTITFSEPVNITASDNYTRFQAEGMSAYQSVLSNADRTEWTLVPSASALNGCKGVADYRFQAKDDLGRTVRDDVYYTAGEKNSTYITISNYCFLAGNAVAVSVPEGVVESLYTFKFTAPTASHKNIGFQGMSPSGVRTYGEIKNKNGEVVATLIGEPEDIVLEESGEYTIGVTMHLDKEVTAPGTYTLSIPGAYFMTGTESSSVGNKPMTFTYYILGAPAPAETDHTVATAGVTTETAIDTDVHEIKVTLKSEVQGLASATLQLAAPEGFTTIYGANMDDLMGGDIEPYYVRRANSEDWVDESEVLGYGMNKIDSIEVPADNKPHTWALMYGNNGKVHTDTWTLTATHQNTVGVSFTLVEGEEAAYYTLQGVRVANPGTGVFVKIANGKAVKVIRK